MAIIDGSQLEVLLINPSAEIWHCPKLQQALKEHLQAPYQLSMPALAGELLSVP